MIEAMEQQIINSIYSRWRKDKLKRVDIDIEKVSECFRVICSSRNSTLYIINKLKSNNFNNDDVLLELKTNLLWIYSWITKEAIESIYENYNREMKNKKKQAEYFSEIPFINQFFNDFQENLINNTINKLLIFHNILDNYK